MKVEIKNILNQDMLAFLDLNIKMYKAIDPSINEFGAINIVVTEINNEKDFKAIGLYFDDKLMGFVRGHCFSNKMFHFTGIYVIMKNNKHTKELIEYCFKLIEDEGYSAWFVDANNSNISSIMEKYGAVPKYTRYVKEINNG